MTTNRRGALVRATRCKQALERVRFNGTSKKTGISKHSYLGCNHRRDYHHHCRDHSKALTVSRPTSIAVFEEILRKVNAPGRVTEVHHG